MPPPPPPSILFETKDRTVVVVDVPRSVEEAQEALCGGSAAARGQQRRRRRLVSVPVQAEPFPTPPGPGTSDAPHNAGGSAAAQLADLTARAAIDRGRDELAKAGFRGPWHGPRCVRGASGRTDSNGDGDGDGDVYIPPGARCLAGTIAACRDEFLCEAPQFDLIVLDPPWPNRSARRRRQGRKRKRVEPDDRCGSSWGGSAHDTGYDTAPDMASMRAMLEQIPVGAKLAATTVAAHGGGGVVAVWVTNKPDCEVLLTDPRQGLFREWGVELVATWTWLKVAANGEPVVPMDSPWRKPWERLLLARRPGGGGGGGGGGGSHDGRTTAAATAESVPPLPRHRVIVGVPDVHSRKPNLRPLLMPFLSPAPAGDNGCGIVGLEVFARNMTAGWWSWGTEVLLFQHKAWWVEGEVGMGAASQERADAVA